VPRAGRALLMMRRLRQDEPMLIEMTTDPVRGHLQALLRIPEPPNARIELEIKLVGASTERAVAEVSRIIDDLRFCVVSACSCAACARHQLNDDSLMRERGGAVCLQVFRDSAAARQARAYKHRPTTNAAGCHRTFGSPRCRNRG
jgi:hypothetical protein